MNEQPSKSKIILAAVIALAVAGVVLVTAVLPAEYGIDPLGTGRALGLIELAEATGAIASADASEPAVADAVQPAASKEPLSKGEIRTTPLLPGWNKDQPGIYRVDSREFEIAPGEGMEFKYVMKKGAGLVYVWNATAAVQYEFHGEPEGSPKGTYESYAKDDKVGKPWGAGNFTAPSDGIHGWYWKNTSKSPVFVRLTSSGFYVGGREFRKSGPIDHKMEDVKIEPHK
jgi:hypothetical protein